MRRCTAPVTWVTGSRAKALRTHLPAVVLGIMRRMLVLIFCISRTSARSGFVNLMWDPGLFAAFGLPSALPAPAAAPLPRQ